MQKANLSRSTRVVVLLLGAAALVLSACSSSNKPSAFVTVTKGPTSGSAPATGSSSSTPVAAAKPVHIKTLNEDGAQYGVGMPVIAFFSKKIKSAKALQAATKVTVDGKPVQGGWYFEFSSYYKHYPIEGHWRPATYWPAHSQVHVDIPAKGLSAGPGMAFDDSLTLDFNIGPKNIALVNDATHRITVTSDGVQKFDYPVSLGASNTPTAHGIKVIMEKGVSICMHGPGYNECGIKYTQRLTYGGEYLHSAPWNTYNIDHGIDSSNGCTNMHDADAKTLYGFLEVGDVVQYPNANGPAMQLGMGYGDWNLSWGAWQTGGLVSTTA